MARTSLCVRVALLCALCWGCQQAAEAGPAIHAGNHLAPPVRGNTVAATAVTATPLRLPSLRGAAAPAPMPCSSWQASGPQYRNGTFAVKLSRDGAFLAVVTRTCAVIGLDVCTGKQLWSLQAAAACHTFWGVQDLVAAKLGSGEYAAVLLGPYSRVEAVSQGKQLWLQGGGGSPYLTKTWIAQTVSGRILAPLNGSRASIDATTGAVDPSFHLVDNLCWYRRRPLLPDAPYMYNLCMRGTGCQPGYVQALHQNTGALVWNASTSGWPVRNQCVPYLRLYEPAGLHNEASVWAMSTFLLSNSPNSSFTEGCHWDAVSGGGSPSCWQSPVHDLSTITSTITGVSGTLAGVLSKSQSSNGTCTTWMSALALLNDSGSSGQASPWISVSTCSFVHVITTKLYPGPGKGQVVGFLGDNQAMVLYIADTITGAYVKTLKLDYSNPFMSCVGIGASAAGVIMKCTASVNNLPAFISYTDPRWQAPASPQLASDVDGPGLTFEFP